MSTTASGPATRDLLRILGVAFGAAVIIGSTVGVGILRTPGPVAALLGSGPFALALWVIGGAYALLGASALADLVTSVPRSGGLYVFAQRALGDGVGFAVGWADWCTGAAALSYGALTFNEFLVLAYPAAAGLGVAPGVLAIMTFAGLHLFGMRVSSRVQEITSFGKALAFLALVAVLFAAPAAPVEVPAAAAAGGLFAGFAAIVLAMQMVIGAYDGWQSASYFAGEDTDPERNLPRALIGGVAVVIVVYVLINMAFLRVLPLSVLAASPLAAADAATVAMGPRGNSIVVWLSALSLLPLISAQLLTNPRILYAMGRDRLLPERVSMLSARGVPVIAVAATTTAGLAMVTVQAFEVMSAVLAFFAITSYSGAFVSLLVLRRREPELRRPYRSWGYPWTTLLVLAGALAMLGGLVVSAPRASAIAIAVLAASYPVYLARSGKRKP